MILHHREVFRVITTQEIMDNRWIFVDCITDLQINYGVNSLSLIADYFTNTFIIIGR